MTLPKKPKLKYVWPERETACRMCGATDRKLEQAHVLGIEYDTREAVVTEIDGRQVRLVTINPDRVMMLCGPVTDTGTCHWKDHNSRLEKWDEMTAAEKAQAIKDAGLGQALRRCAPGTWLDRIEMRDGEQIEVPLKAAA